MKGIKDQSIVLMLLTLTGIVPALFYYLSAGKEIFLGLTWNVFLALLPFYFAIKSVSSGHRMIKYFNTFLWLIFLPNAPYLITDIIHVNRNHGYEGFIVYLVAIMSFTGLLSWLFSVRLMLSRLPGKLRLWKKFSYFAYPALCILSAVGVSMGRFARLNSWELLYNPFGVLLSTIKMYAHFWPWVITLGMYLVLIWIRKIDFGKLSLFNVQK
ncbi:MAG: DUF1361 domain-containing protein [Flavobacteriales bacterium]|nr:DUF1361 domain-containing protein [Flavobacteriales bacterium]